MKLWVALFLVGLLLVRTGLWQRTRERERDLCGFSAAELAFCLQSPSPFVLRGKWRLIEPTVVFLGEVHLFSGQAILSGPQWALSQKPLKGGVWLRGRFRCLSVRRNPGVLEDRLLLFRQPILVGRISAIERRPGSRLRHPLLAIQRSFEQGLERNVGGAPGVKGFVRAVWTGDESGLPKPFQTLYLKAGLLHVLALSGQHIVVMVALMFILVQVGVRLILLVAPVLNGRSFVYHVKRWLPCFACVVLLVTSHGAASVQRTLAMAFAYTLLRYRGLSCSSIQLATSSVACALFWDPTLLGNPGFLLSALATAFLVQLMDTTGWRGWFRGYLLISTLMPVLMLPVIAFFFGKVSWVAPVSNLALGWVWDLLLIPIGFVLPIALSILPGEVRQYTLMGLEVGWQQFLIAHYWVVRWVNPTYHSCVRLTMVELLLVESILLGAVFHLQNRWKRTNIQ